MCKIITTNLLKFDSKVPYTMKRDCDAIMRKFNNYREYMEMPDYGELVSLLEKGIGIHHSGMIPAFREIVESMIGKRTIKLLFAMESFSIGVDCPIRTAIFTNLLKYDNRGQRYGHDDSFGGIITGWTYTKGTHSTYGPTLVNGSGSAYGNQSILHGS